MRRLCFLLPCLLAAASARAEEPEPVSVGLIGFAGFIFAGGGFRVENLMPRQRIELSYAFTAGPAHIGQASVMQPVWFDGSFTLGLRLGYMLLTYSQSDVGRSPRDLSHSLDASLALQIGGKVARVGLEVGPSVTLRAERYYCCDSRGLDTSSVGFRVGLYGEVGFPNAGVFAAASLRTGDVVSGFGALPLLLVGFFLRT
jgi:hypothetical protein